MIALYLAAVVIANLVITAFGPSAVVPVSFALVGFTMTARDRLHERWQGKLTVRMGLLIGAGGLISYLLNMDALPIAIASVVAFTASETAGALVYQPLLKRGVGWFSRANSSNVVAAFTDSVIFVSMAFGFDARIIAAQVAAKILGGFFWSIVLYRRQYAYQTA